MTHKRLQNKIALITGGSRGIGAAIAKRFAKKVSEHFGQLDILVNNAGIYVGGSIDEVNLDTPITYKKQMNFRIIL